MNYVSFEMQSCSPLNTVVCFHSLGIHSEAKIMPPFKLRKFQSVETEKHTTAGASGPYTGLRFVSPDFGIFAIGMDKNG